MDDKELFDKKITRTAIGKNKYLLKKKFQEKFLKKAKQVARIIARNKKIGEVYIIGSAVTKQLGKYADPSKYRSNYSDIDLFVVLKCRLSEVKLSELGLVKRKYKTNKESYYRVSVANTKGEPLRLLDRFSMDLWLITPSTYCKTMNKFPRILDGAIKIK